MRHLCAWMATTTGVWQQSIHATRDFGAALTLADCEAETCAIEAQSDEKAQADRDGSPVAARGPGLQPLETSSTAARASRCEPRTARGPRPKSQFNHGSRFVTRNERTVPASSKSTSR